ncbi:MAG: outer membrane protein assembly factor BamE [Bacteroidaceae bacterium]|nr:outer membrane protein assembly factor BamE [Bacteroidaceae bacterium]
MSLAIWSCSSTRGTIMINKVEIGMTQEDVRHLLGKPMYKSADVSGEEWGYRKQVGKITEPEEVLFIVLFDEQGKVIAYDSVKERPYFHRRQL